MWNRRHTAPGERPSFVPAWNVTALSCRRGAPDVLEPVQGDGQFVRAGASAAAHDEESPVVGRDVVTRHPDSSASRLEEDAGRPAEKSGEAVTSAVIIFFPWRKKSSRPEYDQTGSLPPSVETWARASIAGYGWT